MNRGEFAIGPRFTLRWVTTKLYFGGTTDERAMLAMTVGTSVFGHSIFCVNDAKVTGDERPNTLYQKLWVEHLLVGEFHGFIRVGAEYRHKLPWNSELYIAPYYDTENSILGIQGGWRFYEW